MQTPTQVQHTLSARIIQVIVALSGIIYAVTGLTLLFAPTWFFQHIGTFPPYNQHYEGDLGSFLLALGIGLLFAASNPDRHIWVVRVAAIGNLIHAGNHIYDAVLNTSPSDVWLGQIVPLLLFALILTAVSVRNKPV